MDPYQPIARATAPALRTLDAHAYKALMQMAILKPIGQPILATYAALADLIGGDVRRLRRIIPLLADLHLIDLTRGHPRGQGQGYSPMTIVVRTLPRDRHFRMPEIALTSGEFAPTESAIASVLQPVCKDKKTDLGNLKRSAQASVNSETFGMKPPVGEETTRTPTPPTPLDSIYEGDDEPIVVDLEPGQTVGDTLFDCERVGEAELAIKLDILAQEFFIDLDAKPDTRARWCREVSDLTPSQVRGIMAGRTRAISWPSDFFALRRAWAKRIDAQHAQRQAKLAAQDAQTQQAARQVESDRQAAHLAQAAQIRQRRALALSGDLGHGWRNFLAVQGSAAAWAKDLPMVSLLRVQVYPVALVDGILHIEVQTEDQAARIARHAHVLIESLRSAYAVTHANPITGLSCDLAAPAVLTT